MRNSRFPSSRTRRYLAMSRQIARFENRISGSSGSTLRQNGISRFREGARAVAIVGGKRLRRGSDAYISPRYISCGKISLSVYFLQNEKKETKNAKNLARGHPELIARVRLSTTRCGGGARGNGGARASNRANTRHDVERVETIGSVLCHVRTDTETQRGTHRIAQ